MRSLLFGIDLPVMARGVAGSGGTPDYTYAGGDDKRIPIAFAKKTILKFYDSCVCAQVTNTDYSNEVTAQGDTVVMNTIPTITIYPVTRNMAPVWQQATSDAVTMTVEKAIGFAFRMDKIDIKQFLNKAFMDECAGDAAQQQKIYIDTQFLDDIYGDAAAANVGLTAGAKTSSYNMGYAGTPFPLTRSNIIDKLLEMEGVADEANWPEQGRWCVLPSHFAVLLKQSDIKDASMMGDGTSTLRTGKIGKLGNLNLYTTNLYTAHTDTYQCYYTLYGHISSTCFVSQLVDTEYFEKLESVQSGKGMKGTQVYDWKVVKADALAYMYAYKA
jgi:hypothetical protein